MMEKPDLSNRSDLSSSRKFDDTWIYEPWVRILENTKQPRVFDDQIDVYIKEQPNSPHVRLDISFLPFKIIDEIKDPVSSRAIQYFNDAILHLPLVQDVLGNFIGRPVSPQLIQKLEFSLRFKIFPIVGHLGYVLTQLLAYPETTDDVLNRFKIDVVRSMIEQFESEEWL